MLTIPIPVDLRMHIMLLKTNIQAHIRIYIITSYTDVHNVSQQKINVQSTIFDKPSTN